MFSPTGKPHFLHQSLHHEHCANEGRWRWILHNLRGFHEKKPTSWSVSDKKKLEKNDTEKKNITFSEFCEFQFNQPKRLFFFLNWDSNLESEMAPVPPEYTPEVVIVYSLGKSADYTNLRFLSFLVCQTSVE